MWSVRTSCYEGSAENNEKCTTLYKFGNVISQKKPDSKVIFGKVNTKRLEVNIGQI